MKMMKSDIIPEYGYLDDLTVVKCDGGYTKKFAGSDNLNYSFLLSQVQLDSKSSSENCH